MASAVTPVPPPHDQLPSGFVVVSQPNDVLQNAVSCVKNVVHAALVGASSDVHAVTPALTLVACASSCCCADLSSVGVQRLGRMPVLINASALPAASRTTAANPPRHPAPQRPRRPRSSAGCAPGASRR